MIFSIPAGVCVGLGADPHIHLMRAITWSPVFQGGIRQQRGSRLLRGRRGDRSHGCLGGCKVRERERERDQKGGGHEGNGKFLFYWEQGLLLRQELEMRLEIAAASGSGSVMSQRRRPKLHRQ